MSKREMDEMDTTGYFLPEDSQFRLKMLHGHMVFLSQLAQPRTYDEVETGRGPEINGDELAVCLELLAEQAERVLDEVAWPAERKAGREQSRACDEDDLDDWAEAEAADDALAAAAQDDEAGEPPPARSRADVTYGAAPAGPRDEASEAASPAHAHADLPGATPPADAQAGAAEVEGDLQPAAEADEASAAADSEDAEDTENGRDAPKPLHFGMTLDQLDTLNRLHDRLHAFGDLVFGAEQLELADGTLSTLGDVIFEEAAAASDLMNQVACQSLPDPRYGKPRVREAHGAYGVPTSPGPVAQAARPRLPSPASTGWATSPTTVH